MNFIQRVFKNIMKLFKNDVSKNSSNDVGSGSRNSVGSGRNSTGSGRNSAGSGRNSAGSGRNSAGSGRNSVGSSDTGNLEQPVENSEILNGVGHDPASGDLWKTMMDYQKTLNQVNKEDEVLRKRDGEEEYKNKLKEGELDATQKSVAPMRTEVESKIQEEKANLLPDLGRNLPYANAINDVKADIARHKKIMSAHEAAATADEKAAEANFAAAENLEGDAGNLEQPVTPDNKKNKLILPASLGGVLILFLIIAVLLNSRKLPVVGAPTAEPASPTSEPVPALRIGLTMA